MTIIHESISTKPMQNLVETISKRAELDKEKATQVLLLISEHVKSEFPLLHSVVDLVLGTRKFSHHDTKLGGADFPDNRIIYN